jgi:hypothetical protein
MLEFVSQGGGFHGAVLPDEAQSVNDMLMTNLISASDVAD